MRIIHRGDLLVHVNTHPVLHLCHHEAEISWPFLSSGSRHVPFNVVAHQLLWPCAVIHRKKKGDIMVADVEELETMDASESMQKRLNAKEVLSSKENGKFICPVADGRTNFLEEIRN